MIRYLFGNLFIAWFQYLNFCPEFFGHLGNWLDKKAKADFKTCDAINWEANNSNTHIAQYLTI